MFAEICQQLSNWAIPVVLFLIPVAGYLRGIKVYEAFVEGAKEGFQTAVRIMPCLVAMLVAIGIFRASGAMEACIAQLQPLLTTLGVPPDLVPMAVMRPLSGTGSLGLATEILNTHGPDSINGRIASTILASTDTTFYVLTVYFGAVGISKSRYAIIVGLTGDIVSFLASVYICKLVFF
ncbi:MAG TPA: spore maturation protein [Methylomusa anaerophila]|uniref:Spore maturation protein B n=1 Tax=Methylomusa anaerophila TaxID=1930071 RepID=A0A348APG4_9FIRM|nr:spore maturation protein [Methylomusa anaerophila]BBB92962.1 spore maturation protein B [Methylomusa anaerophila]HML87204.1 spore maturation protein [Methylomusa anaerophila]